jgi:CelD/BcsL family acetyltransferase involved in cellulose biosynthesis
MERTAPATLEHLDAKSTRWLDFAQQHKQTLFQSADWGGVIASTYGFPARVAALVRGGQVVVGLPYAEVDDFRGRRRVAFAFADVCEPLGNDWPALERALCEDGVAWQIRSRVAPGPLGDAREVGVHQSVSLAGGADGVRSRLHPKQRANALAGERAGLTHRLLSADEAVETFYALHSRVRVAKHRLLPQPRTFFERLAECFFPDRGFVVAAHAAGRTVSAMLFIKWGDTLYYKFSASDLDALELHPNHYLLGKVVEEAVREGFTSVDLGISEDEGLVRFKRRLGADAVPVFSGKYLQPEKNDEVRTMETALGDLTRILTEPGVPIAAAQVAGDAVYRYFA